MKKMKRTVAVLVAALTLCGTALAQYVTLSGTLQSSNGMPASNYILSFTPSQMGFVSGTGIVINAATYCATSTDGSVVGIPNPLIAPSVTTGFTGTLPPANYFVKIAFYDASGNLTLVSPETVTQLNSTGQIIVASPSSGMPAGATGMKVYISTTTNAETLQGQTTGSAAFIQSVPLVSGAAVPSSNTTICKQVANDTIWPSGTGYTVALTDPSGNTLPGYPMQWQLMGPNTTINLSNGLPYYHGTVYFPSPILASPLNHGLQSISGPLSLSGYNLTNVGAIGLGTTMPAWPIDVEDGAINASGGYLYNGAAPLNHVLLGNGSAYVDSPTIPYSVISGAPTAYYQTVAANGSAQTQRPTLNFAPRFSVSDSGSPAQTTVDLANVGTAGTYGNPSSITLNAFGQITAVTSGGGITPTPRTCVSNATMSGCYSISADGTIEQWATGTASFTDRGQTFVTWPIPFPNSCSNVQTTVQFNSPITTTNWQGAAFYVQPGDCKTSVQLQVDIRGDGVVDGPFHVLLYAKGW